jgi:beta-glucosidase
MLTTMKNAPAIDLAESEKGAGELLRRFPAGFVWGVATSAYQIEGAAHVDGRADSIWDEFCRRPGAIRDGSSGEVACDHYHRFESDLDLIAELGIKAYRFSVSWPRVQPQGRGAWNEAGFAFYARLIDGMRRRGIAAHATLNHWDLPQALQERGGWDNRDTVHAFVDYAVDFARRFGPQLASIATHNEPWVAAILGHEQGIFAPGVRNRRTAMQVAHHLLVSHGLALRAIRATGCVVPLGIVLNQSPIHPATESAADVAKARIEDGLIIRWYMDALLRGAYPADVLEHLGGDAPAAEPGDMELIRQPLDFLGINYYTRSIAHAGEHKYHHGPHLRVTDMGWEVFPDGLTELLVRLDTDYSLPAVYIMENGAAYKDEVVGGRVADTDRIEFLRTHIAALADALETGVDVRGYFVWSLLDNFEWADGYSKRFGIVRVDYDTQQRIVKDSAFWYRDFLRGQGESR